MNQLQLYIENLGEIKQAELTINPLTVLVGENGTGKSFVTKFLYSVLNILGRNILDEELVKLRSSLFLELNFLEQLIVIDDYPFLKEIINDIDKSSDDKLLSIFDRIYNFTWGIANGGYTRDYNLTIQVENKIRDIEEKIVFSLKEENKNKIYAKYLAQEIKDNFQISNIKELIHFGEEKTIFEIKGIIKIEIDKKQGLTTELYTQQSFELNRGMAFFESSVYWKLAPHLMKNANEEFLGIPKHFLDLKELLSKRFKDDDERPEFIVEIADELEKTLQGQFEFIADDIIYRKNSGQKLSKNLISFGITNLGIIQLLLSKNIVNRGSFIFIDEPESNLHPAWQAVLANILVKLAKHGVYIIMTTHSSDVLKALDVISQEHQQNEDFISVHYFERTGHLLALNQSEHSHIQQARLKLLETYDDLVLRGYLV